METALENGTVMSIRQSVAAAAIVAQSAVLGACMQNAETQPSTADERAASLQATAAPTGEIGPPKSLRNANYSIDARLDPASRTIRASEIVSWRNVTSRPTDELQFHLYWNAWRDTRSTFMRERALRGRPPTRRPGGIFDSRCHVNQARADHRAGRPSVLQVLPLRARATQALPEPRPLRST